MRGSTVGISDNFKTKNRKHYVLLSFIDTFFSVFVVGPLVITFWRGQWCLMDIYVCPAYPFESATISFLVGIFGHYLLTILQRPLTRNLHPERHRLTFYVVSRLYTVCFGFSCVSFWRGAFLYLDIYTGTNIALVASSTALSAVALTVLKTLRNISAPPFLVSMDSCQDYFQVQTMFRMALIQLFMIQLLFKDACKCCESPIRQDVIGRWLKLDYLKTPQEFSSKPNEKKEEAWAQFSLKRVSQVDAETRTHGKPNVEHIS
ncbi:unnamed protein product [Timema podura]|uniref:Vomeronasal type-1 receptor n=1 Tax=Timema podura TaxID=61482 RepID=A0ABN7NVU3_TIMPD|nr:unnamed protein product [Timema podura]